MAGPFCEPVSTEGSLGIARCGQETNFLIGQLENQQRIDEAELPTDETPLRDSSEYNPGSGARQRQSKEPENLETKAETR